MTTLQSASHRSRHVGLTEPNPTTQHHAAADRNSTIELVGAQRALLDSLPDVTWIKNVDGALTAVNAAFGERYGMTPAAAVGKTDFDIYPPEKAQLLRDEDRQVMATGQTLRYESTQIYGGREYWVEVVKGPVFDPAGGIIGTSGRLTPCPENG